MAKILLTYFFAIAFFSSLMAPTLCSLYSLICDPSEDHITFTLIDSDKEENEGQNENETKDHKEKETSEDEKLRHLNDKFSILYLKNVLCSQSAYAVDLYNGVERTVPTPPPES